LKDPEPTVINDSDDEEKNPTPIQQDKPEQSSNQYNPDLINEIDQQLIKELGNLKYISDELKMIMLKSSELSQYKKDSIVYNPINRQTYE
jgi:hypothetical protein